MSDAVTNVEIEDVLSSVKRLIAETPVTPTAPKPQETDVSENPSRLVLTPALRVEDEPEAVKTPVSSAAPLILQPEQAAPVDASLSSQTQQPEAHADLEHKIAELEAAVTSQAQEWEPDGSEEQQAQNLGSVLSMKATSDAVKIADTVWQTQEAPVAPVDVITEEPTAELGFRFHPSEAESDAGDDYGDDFQDEDADDEGLPIPDNLDANIAAYISGGPQMDQTALRELIVDVVQQELRGEMGERVTRNVRKMVRREIYRALAAQKLT